MPLTDLDLPARPRRPRIELVDLVRTLALVAMAIYHFTWDLDYHGLLAHGTATEGGWRLFARGIATSFLFLVGISLVLAHGERIRWRSFLTREVQVVAGAAAISAVTFFVTPESFVFFGILHQIAFASFVGLVFVRLPGPVALLAGLVVIALPFLVSTSLTEPKALAWIGMATRAPVTNDYVPVFPWTGVVLLGIAAAKLLDRTGAWERLARLNAPLRRLRPLTVLGRHSLLFYLLHQPVLFGLVAAYVAVFPPDQVALFAKSCRHECRVSRDAATCETFCSCVQNRLAADKLLDRFIAGQTTDPENSSIRQTVLQCSFPDLPATP